MFCTGLGAKGGKAIAEALKPLKNLDGSWCYNHAFQALDLACGSSFSYFSHGEGNGIGPEGARAIADALKPRKNLDKYWSRNQALMELKLSGESSPFSKIFPLDLRLPLSFRYDSSETCTPR